MKTLREFFEGLVARARGQKGQTVIEYVLVIVLIALVLLVAFRTGGIESGIETASSNIGTQLEDASAAPE